MPRSSHKSGTRSSQSQSNKNENKQTLNIYLSDYMKKKKGKSKSASTKNVVAPTINISPIVSAPSVPHAPNYYRGFGNRPYPYAPDTSGWSDPGAPPNYYFPQSSADIQAANNEDSIAAQINETQSILSSLPPEQQAAAIADLMDEEPPAGPQIPVVLEMHPMVCVTFEFKALTLPITLTFEP
jgi:hypothetical protein